MAARLHGAWYALVAVPIAIGAAVAAWALMAMVGDIKAMPRLEVPGEHDLQLVDGAYIIYGETASVVDGRPISNLGFHARCSLTGDAGALDLRTRSSSTSYSLGDYKGESMFEVDVPHTGSYHLACDGGPGVVAIGHGIGKRIIVVVVSLLAGIAAGVILLFLIRRQRRRAH